MSTSKQQKKQKKEKPKQHKPKKQHAKRVTKGTVSGHGGYFGDLGRSIGGSAGGVVDGVVSIAKVLGFGDYKVKSNTLAENGGPPAVVNSRHSNIIRHREYLGDVYGTTAFSITNYPINPGQALTFPWLAPIAASYEQYRVRGMLFEYLSTASNSVAATNIAQGTVILATEYNSNLPPFANKMQMENHEYSSTCKPADSVIHPIECASKLIFMNMLYVRTGTTTQAGGGTPATGSYNPLSYDLGQFQIATMGLQTAANIGELWVTYEIEFFKPQILSTLTSNVFQHYYWDSALGTKPSSSFPLANLRNKNTGQSVTTPFATGIYNIPAGNWLLLFSLGNVIGQSVTWPSLTPSGATALNLFDTNTAGVSTVAYSAQPPNGVTGSGDFLCMYAFSAGATWFFTCGGATLPSSFTTFDFYLIPFGSALSATSRKAVDWDPLTLLNRRLDVLFERVGRTIETIDEKHEPYDAENHRVEAYQLLQDNNGVQSVDSTPETVKRQLDNLKLQLTGKFPIPAHARQ